VFIYNENSPVSFCSPLPGSVDVVVIGGGVIGISTAWFLRQRGLSVLVCDKGRVAGEQSSRNWGWVRTMGRDADEVPIAMDSVNLWEEFAQQLGDGIGFRREGILFLAETDDSMTECETWLKIADKYGLDTRMVLNRELGDTIKVDAGKWKGGMITPGDARAEPFTAVKTIAEGLIARGGLVRESCAVRSIEKQAGKLSAVVTEHGTVKTQAVVCAAGAWSTIFLANMGVSLPQLAVRGTVARTQAAPSIFEGAAGFEDVFVRRRQDGGYTVATGMVEHTIGANSFRFLPKFLPSTASASDLRMRFTRDVTQPSFLGTKWGAEDVSPFEYHRVLNPAPSEAALKMMRDRLKQRIPELSDVPFIESWAGMMDATPDVVPVMDRIPGNDGLFLATGFSGHGFGIGPGAGRVMADMITGESQRYDLTRFRFSRFSDGSKMVPGPGL
jgi:glycine/D-amino acid oxidase-like deaminating enzyme